MHACRSPRHTCDHACVSGQVQGMRMSTVMSISTHALSSAMDLQQNAVKTLAVTGCMLQRHECTAAECWGAVESLPGESPELDAAAVQEVPLGWLRELPVHLHPDSPSLHSRAAGIPQEQRKIRYQTLPALLVVTS